MSKAPAFQFYVRDWLSDPQLKMASHQSKGIWIDLLCYMWEAPERGTLTGTVQEYCRMIGTTEPEFIRFLDEAKRLKFASVTESNGKVTLENRRMMREEKERKNNALRQARFKSNGKGNGEGNEKVTSPSSSSSSSSKKKDLVSFSLAEDIDPDIWKAFVEHRRNLKKPLTEYAKKLILSKLDKIGQDKNAVLNQAIVKGWQDVFPLKDEEPMSSKTSFGLSPDEEKFLNEQEERERG